MGHRKHNAPRRGSLAFYPRARHGLLVPRVRNWVMLGGDRPMLAGFPAFKVGMIHAIVVDDREKTPNFGKPTFNPATVVSLPDIHVYGVRAYTRIEAQKDSCAIYLRMSSTKLPVREFLNLLPSLIQKEKKERSSPQRLPIE